MITSNKLGIILLLFGKIVEVGVCHNYGRRSWLNLRGGKRYLKKEGSIFDQYSLFLYTLWNESKMSIFKKAK